MATRFRQQERPLLPITRQNRKLPALSGYQTTTTLSWHGKLYRHFLPNCAQVLKPLTNHLKGGGGETLQWTAATQEAFQQAKRLPAAAVPFQHPAPNAELSLTTDASNTHIGGVMQQKSKDHWQTLGFFTRKLTDTESRYSTFDCELLAAQAAIKHFRHFCYYYSNIYSVFQFFTYIIYNEAYSTFAKVVFSTCGLTTNPLSLPFLVFQHQSPPDNSATWRLFQSSMYSFCIYLV